MQSWLGPQQDGALVQELCGQHTPAARPLWPSQDVPEQQRRWDAAVAALQLLVALVNGPGVRPLCRGATMIFTTYPHVETP